jgi:hypothetical protein
MDGQRMLLAAVQRCIGGRRPEARPEVQAE